MIFSLPRLAALALLAAPACLLSQHTLRPSASAITFESVPISNDSVENGSNWQGYVPAGRWVLRNSYNAEWMSWSGVAVSRMADTLTSGFGNQYSAAPGRGVAGSRTYAVAYAPAVLVPPGRTALRGLYVTNSVYAWHSMRDGDQFSKKFGGSSGADPDFFALTAYGWRDGVATDSAVFMLADYRGDDDYIVTDWRWFNLSSLGEVDSVSFRLASSDVGEFGMNTPAYFCFDDVNGASFEVLQNAAFDDAGLPANTFWNGSDSSEALVSGSVTVLNSYNPEWMSWSGFAVSTMVDTVTSGFGNQYSAAPGAGARNSSAYAVGYNDAVLALPEVGGGVLVSQVSVANSVYAWHSMRDGDQFAKKFGGASGADPDFFSLTIYGHTESGAVADSVVVYLADFRSDVPAGDFILTGWQDVDLSVLGKVAYLSFHLASSDVGDFGMNTPAYFCLDDVAFSPLTTVEESPKTSPRPRLRAYPLPASTRLTVDFSALPVSVQPVVAVVSSRGERVEVPFTFSGSSADLDVSGLASGSYIVVVESLGTLSSTVISIAR